jgi:hypothetical protein
VDELPVLSDGLVDRVGGVRQVLQNERDVLTTLFRTDGPFELGGHRADAVGDLLDLVEDLAWRRLFGDRVDLVAVVKSAMVGRARRQDHDRLPEQRCRFLAERGVLEESHVGAHLHVEPRLTMIQTDRLECSDGNPGDRHARARGQPGRVMNEGMNGIGRPAAELRADESVDAERGGPREYDEEPDACRLRASRHVQERAKLPAFCESEEIRCRGRHSKVPRRTFPAR